MTTWQRASLGEVLELVYGHSLPKALRDDEGRIPVYGSNGITGWHSECLLQGPAVIVGRKGSAGIVQFAEGPCFPIDTTYYVKPRDGYEFDMRFLFYLLRHINLTRLRTATGVPGLTREDAYKERIAFPGLSHQRRIVDLLSRAEGIVRLRREAQAKAQALIPALFLEMFGDPITNPKGLPTIPIDDLCMLVRGSSPRPQGDPKFFGGSVPRLMIGDITRDGVYVTPRIDSLTEKGAQKSRPMLAGEVVMAVSGAVGLPAILAVDACIHDGFVGFRALDSRISPEYLYNYLVAFRKLSVSQAIGATFQNLKTDQIRSWRIPMPTEDAQQFFTGLVKRVRVVEEYARAALAKSEAVFQSLLGNSFESTGRL